MNVAFFAPMKSPRHPVPSGDRLMARQLIKVLKSGATDVQLASELRIHTREPCPQRLREIKSAATEEVQRLIAEWFRKDWQPDVWFSYHPYYKAPDFIGPAIAKHFDVPMVTAEASYAKRRATGEWADWHAGNLECLQAAQCHFTMTMRDRRGLQDMPQLAADLVDLPPFIDTTDFARDLHYNAPQGAVRLVTVAMMRDDVKYDSYLFLSQALAQLSDLDWTLDIVGDGSARSKVERDFTNLPPRRVIWHGKLERAEVIEILKRANLFVWPGIDEAYGLAFLEAQATGLPVVALDNAGVAEVVRHNETGLLSLFADPTAYAQAIRSYIINPAQLKQHSKHAHTFVMKERSLSKARQKILQTLEHVKRTHKRI